jgi:hypothetical protein
MTHQIMFYAILRSDSTIDRPRGLIRRLRYENGWEDEALHRDMSWRRTSLLIEKEHGSTDSDELVEVSHEQASRIVEYLRQMYGAEGST